MSAALYRGGFTGHPGLIMAVTDRPGDAQRQEGRRWIEAEPRFLHALLVGRGAVSQSLQVFQCET